ncbi:GNAT family N-acetyltransferase [Sphingomonas sp.]|uniref:GNAT family N-acetyltransferase n=1 Tax=Sphingomonas sp. TaxID=28214 RepID=UPI0026007EFA|nr:GNAT family N-acetyltransferase [Sphingomonas sp.]
MSYVVHPSSDTVTVDVVPFADVPAAWEPAWRDLAQRAAEPAPFAESWFLRPSLEHLAPPSGGRLLAAWQGPTLIGVIALATARRYGRIPTRHVQNWQHYHSFLGTPLIRSGAERAFWEALLAELDDADWAPSFLHLCGMVEGGPVLAALRDVRRTDIVHRAERAFLHSDLSPDAYYQANIRKKKRKEIGRLQARLREVGPVSCERLADDGAIADWTNAFLEVEASGWKGRGRTALRDDPATARFFREALAGAHAVGKLEMLRLTVDGRAIAMLVNLITAPGSFSYKIAYDEAFARYSPGVLIQIENLNILDRPGIDWMDSCAVEDHAMINSIWAERREIVRVTVPLRGKRRTLAFNVCRALENASAALRGAA